MGSMGGRGGRTPPSVSLPFVRGGGDQTGSVCGLRVRNREPPQGDFTMISREFIPRYDPRIGPARFPHHKPIPGLRRPDYPRPLFFPSSLLPLSHTPHTPTLLLPLPAALIPAHVDVHGADLDAAAAGLVDAPDAATKSRTLFAYYQGLVTEARIQNNLEILRDAVRGTFDLLGVKTAEPVTA